MHIESKEKPESNSFPANKADSDCKVTHTVVAFEKADTSQRSKFDNF